MSISMYSASLPICTTVLSNLAHVLDKAQAFVDVKKCDPTALTQYRLAPDMLPFTRQVLIACDAAKRSESPLSSRTSDNSASIRASAAESRRSAGDDGRSVRGGAVACPRRVSGVLVLVLVAWWLCAGGPRPMGVPGVGLPTPAARRVARVYMRGEPSTAQQRRATEERKGR